MQSTVDVKRSVQSSVVGTAVLICRRWTSLIPQRKDLSNPVYLSQRRVQIDRFFRAQFGGKFESRREVTIVLRVLTKFYR
ncbi:hypothetical protein ASD00_33740 [Ensifer sp. Root31]|nr:hypothetical protein ASD00_33740 [Ensifer sp. Root31]